MAHFSTYLANKVLDHVFRNVAYTPPATVYVALFTAAPTDAGGGTEVSGGSYGRVALTFSAASAGAIANSIQEAFAEASGSWGTVVAWGIYDASSGGNLLAWNTITNFAVAAGETRFWAIGELSVSLD